MFLVSIFQVVNGHCPSRNDHLSHHDWIVAAHIGFDNLDICLQGTSVQSAHEAGVVQTEVNVELRLSGYSSTA